MTDLPLSPVLATIPTLKKRARRMREGQEMPHAAALEAVAHAAGLRDWNTLAAKAAPAPTMQRLKVGERVAGLYLRQPFTATIRALQSSFAGGVHRITLKFEAPVLATGNINLPYYRHQVTMEINDDGTSDGITSDGHPHLVLEL